MGAACCIAARDRTIHRESSYEIVHRNFRHSPSWSFRRDSRVGVDGEDISIGWLSNVASRSDAQDVKSATDVSALTSDCGSSLESYQTGVWQKSPLSHESSKNFRSSASDQSITRNATVEVKTEFLQLSITASLKQPPLMHTASSLCVSPLSSQSNPPPPSPIPSIWGQGSPAHFLEDRHALPVTSVASNESTRGSCGRSSVGWSAHAFSNPMSLSQKDREPFDSDSCSLTRAKLTRTSGQNSRSMSMDFQLCGICSKTLSEKSAPRNELSVVSVLMCGHVYHAECLETVTPEIYKYDPACPVCTFGEKQILKLTRKMLKAENDLKANKSRRSRNKALDDYTHGSFDFAAGKSPELITSSSLKSLAAKPFLKRHFSLGSRGNKFASEMKGLFWAKSSRE